MRPCRRPLTKVTARWNLRGYNLRDQMYFKTAESTNIYALHNVRCTRTVFHPGEMQCGYCVSSFLCCSSCAESGGTTPQLRRRRAMSAVPAEMSSSAGSRLCWALEHCAGCGGGRGRGADRGAPTDHYLFQGGGGLSSESDSAPRLSQTQPLASVRLSPSPQSVVAQSDSAPRLSQTQPLASPSEPSQTQAQPQPLAAAKCNPDRHSPCQMPQPLASDPDSDSDSDADADADSDSDPDSDRVTLQHSDSDLHS
eukprot:gene19407-biopygen13020